MLRDPVDVWLVGIGDEAERALHRDGGFRVRSAAAVAAIEGDADVVVVSLRDTPPLEAIREIRRATPDAAVVVVTDVAGDAEGTVALHAGAEEHLLDDGTLPAVIPRAVRYAAEIRRLRRDLATTDEPTGGLPNLRGFVPIAEHHLRMADRTEQPVVFVFVRFEEADDEPETDELAAEAAGVLLDAVRASDIPARISRDTFCVLLAGSADGAETLVLSRLVEAIARHDAGRDRPLALALSVGSARYEPGSGTSLSAIVEAAERRLDDRTDARA